MADAGVASRRASEKLILEGRVKVNGVVVKELGTKVKGDDAIEVNGTLIERERNKVYYLFISRAALSVPLKMIKAAGSLLIILKVRRIGFIRSDVWITILRAFCF